MSKSKWKGIQTIAFEYRRWNKPSIVENNNEIIEVPKEILCTNDIINEIYDNSSDIAFINIVIFSEKKKC